MIGEQQIIKIRDKSGADPFATENVAQEIIDAKIAREHLNEFRNLINLRFRSKYLARDTTERKRRIDEAKERKEKQLPKEIEKERKFKIFNLCYHWCRCIFCIISLIIYAFLLFYKIRPLF